MELTLKQCSQSEKATVIFEMVDTLARETELPLKKVCEIIAEYKGWSRKRIEFYLNLKNPSYLLNNAYYENGKLIQKNKINEQCVKILIDNVLPLTKQSPFMHSTSFLKQIFKDNAMEMAWYN